MCHTIYSENIVIRILYHVFAALHIQAEYASNVNYKTHKILNYNEKHKAIVFAIMQKAWRSTEDPKAPNVL